MAIQIFFDEFSQRNIPDHYNPEHELVDWRHQVEVSPLLIDKEPHFAKPHWLIEAAPETGSLPLSSRRLLNVITALSWDTLTDKTSDVVFGAYASDVRRAIGQANSSGNAQLRNAIDELATTPLVFPRLNKECPLLNDYQLHKGDGIIAWQFTEELREALGAGSAWGWINLAESLKLSSKYAHTLYEFACLYENRTYPFLSGTPDELRFWFGVGDSLQTWQAFNSRALQPAIKWLKEQTRFDVRLDSTESPRTHGVAKVRLTFKANKTKET